VKKVVVAQSQKDCEDLLVQIVSGNYVIMLLCYYVLLSSPTVLLSYCLLILSYVLSVLLSFNLLFLLYYCLLISFSYSINVF
jgi:hypothetical protein